MKRLLPLLLTALFLVGCAGPSEEAPDPTWEEYQQSQLQDMPQVSPAAPADTFSLPYHKDRTLDPFLCSEDFQLDVVGLLYEPLFQLDQQFEPIPYLCQNSQWDESGLVCTLDIQPGVLFSDGSELTAADVAYSLRRAAESERYRYRFRHMISITANRNGQVILTLSKPNSAFTALLDIPVIKQGSANLPVPVGSGPYLFITGKDGAYLQSNSDWWQKKSLPVDTIPLVQAKDQDTAAYLFSSRRIELLKVDPTNQTALSGQRVETTQSTALFQFIGFNTTAEPFASQEARRIFSQGLPRQMLADAFLSGHAQKTYFPIHPASLLYPSALEQSSNYEETVTALRSSGYDTGSKQELIFLVNEEDSFRLSSANYIAETMSLLDWNITVKALPWEEYLLALTEGEFDLYYGEMRLTADWDLRDLLETDGSINYGGYTDADTDALLDAFSKAADRKTASEQLCTHLVETSPIAPVCFRNCVIMTHPGVVEDLSPLPGNTFAGLSDWAIHLA